MGLVPLYMTMTPDVDVVSVNGRELRNCLRAGCLRDVGGPGVCAVDIMRELGEDDLGKGGDPCPWIASVHQGGEQNDSAEH